MAAAAAVSCKTLNDATPLARTSIEPDALVRLSAFGIHSMGEARAAASSPFLRFKVPSSLSQGGLEALTLNALSPPPPPATAVASPQCAAVKAPPPPSETVDETDETDALSWSDLRSLSGPRFDLNIKLGKRMIADNFVSAAVHTRDVAKIAGGGEMVAPVKVWEISFRAAPHVFAKRDPEIGALFKDASAGMILHRLDVAAAAATTTAAAAAAGLAPIQFFLQRRNASTAVDLTAIDPRFLYMRDNIQRAAVIAQNGKYVRNDGHASFTYRLMQTTAGDEVLLIDVTFPRHEVTTNHVRQMNFAVLDNRYVVYVSLWMSADTQLAFNDLFSDAPAQPLPSPSLPSPSPPSPSPPHDEAEYRARYHNDGLELLDTSNPEEHAWPLCVDAASETLSRAKTGGSGVRVFMECIIQWQPDSSDFGAAAGSGGDDDDDDDVVLQFFNDNADTQSCEVVYRRGGGLFHLESARFMAPDVFDVHSATRWWKATGFDAHAPLTTTDPRGAFERTPLASLLMPQLR